MLLVVATWVSLVISSTLSSNSIPIKATVAEYEQEIDLQGLPDNVDFNEFEHHKQLFAAIQQGEKTFTVSENKFGKSVSKIR